MGAHIHKFKSGSLKRKSKKKKVTEGMRLEHGSGGATQHNFGALACASVSYIISASLTNTGNCPVLIKSGWEDSHHYRGLLFQ